MKNKQQQRGPRSAFSDDLIATMEKSWQNEKHVAQWRMTMNVYAAPLRDMHVQDIATHDVLVILKPAISVLSMPMAT